MDKYISGFLNGPSNNHRGHTNAVESIKIAPKGPEKRPQQRISKETNFKGVPPPSCLEPVPTRKTIKDNEPNDYHTFNNCRSWLEVVNYHKKRTPWLDDTQINEFVKLYKMEAQTKIHKGLLAQDKQWMLNDL